MIMGDSETKNCFIVFIFSEIYRIFPINRTFSWQLTISLSPAPAFLV